MESFTESMGKVWATIQPWAQRNVTFGLILAIVTEVPRWTFAFAAAHEPIWAGCALAALMSYAAAHAWEEYFAQHDWLLLLLNSLSLVFGVFTISPVIFAMTSGGGHAVDMKQVLPVWLLWGWSIVLASTTFLPLIQVAVVEVRRRARLQVTQPVKPKVKPAATPTIVEPLALPVIDATTQPDEAQPVAIIPEFQAQPTALDEIDNKILDALRNGAYTPYAISKHTGILQSTLKRPKAKGSNEYVGRLPKLVAAGYIHNSSGADGSEYRING